MSIVFHTCCEASLNIDRKPIWSVLLPLYEYEYEYNFDIYPSTVKFSSLVGALRGQNTIHHSKYIAV
jgi:hypothetical protein